MRSTSGSASAGSAARPRRRRVLAPEGRTTSGSQVGGDQAAVEEGRRHPLVPGSELPAARTSSELEAPGSRRARRAVPGPGVRVRRRRDARRPRPARRRRRTLRAHRRQTGGRRSRSRSDGADRCSATRGERHPVERVDGLRRRGCWTRAPHCVAGRAIVGSRQARQDQGHERPRTRSTPAAATTGSTARGGCADEVDCGARQGQGDRRLDATTRAATAREVEGALSAGRSTRGRGGARVRRRGRRLRLRRGRVLGRDGLPDRHPRLRRRAAARGDGRATRPSPRPCCASSTARPRSRPATAAASCSRSTGSRAREAGTRSFDWFFYVNGVESPVGAAEVRVVRRRPRLVGLPRVDRRDARARRSSARGRSRSRTARGQSASRCGSTASARTTSCSAVAGSLESEGVAASIGERGGAQRGRAASGRRRDVGGGPRRQRGRP